MYNFEKLIYNNFLEVSKKINNKPVRYRKNFDNFSDENYLYINKLSTFFKKFNHINIKDFFEAPYFVYNDNYYDLKFYLSQRAIKSYTLYNDNYLLNNPDSHRTIEKLKDSVKFIYNFCKEKDISIKNYLNFIEGNYNNFLTHLKERKINIFILFSFKNFESIMNGIDPEIKSIYNSNLIKLNYIRTKYYTSSRAKVLINNFKNMVESQD